MKSNKTAILTSLLTIFSLLGVMLLQLVVRVNAIKDNYTLYTCIFIGIMALIILFAYVFKGTSSKKKKPSFNYPMLISWVLMCILMLVSDITVFKQYWFLSLILLVLFTGLFFVLGRYTIDQRDRLWRLFVIAIEIAFLAATVFCFLFRPYTVGIRYSGLSANPNVYAMFLISVWICIITRFEIMVNNKKAVASALIPGIEFGTALFFLYMTGARTSFAAIFVVTLIWIIFRFYYTRKEKVHVLKYTLTAIGGAIPAFILSYVLLSTVPGIIGHPVEFERDRMFTALEYEDTTCYAAEESADTAEDAVTGQLAAADQNAVTDEGAVTDQGVTPVDELDSDSSLLNRIKNVFRGDSTLDTMLNGRLSIYESYMKKIDNKGHKKYNKKVNGENVVNAHNNALQIAYSYGRPAGILYVIMTVLAIIYSVRLFITDRKKRSTAILPMLIVLAFTITSLTECILLPIQSLLAFAFYLAVGELINTKYDYKSK